MSEEGLESCEEFWKITYHWNFMMPKLGILWWFVRLCGSEAEQKWLLIKDTPA